jgi:hypothetical protein
MDPAIIIGEVNVPAGKLQSSQNKWILPSSSAK